MKQFYRNIIAALSSVFSRRALSAQEKKFENAVIAACCFAGCFIAFMAKGWIIPAGFFGILACVAFVAAIFNACVDMGRM